MILEVLGKAVLGKGPSVENDEEDAVVHLSSFRSSPMPKETST